MNEQMDMSLPLRIYVRNKVEPFTMRNKIFILINFSKNWHCKPYHGNLYF